MAVNLAISNLRTNQRQLDADGCEVGVSRQALDETLALYGELLAALTAIVEYEANPDFSLWAKRVDAGRAAIAKAGAQ